MNYRKGEKAKYPYGGRGVGGGTSDGRAGAVFGETKNCTVRWRQRIVLNFLLGKLQNE